MPDEARRPALRGGAPPVRSLPAWQFDRAAAQKAARASQLGTLDLAGFGADETPLAVGAAGALLHYAGGTQQAALSHVRALTVETGSEFVALDPATAPQPRDHRHARRRRRADAASRCSTRCATAAGSRLLRHWLTQPLRVAGRASPRHDGIDALRADRRAAHAIADALKQHGRRRARRSGAWRCATSRPRDLAGLRDTLAQLPEIAALLARDRGRAAARGRARPVTSPSTPQWATSSRARSRRSPRRSCATAASSPPGFDAELDELRAIDANCGEFLVALEARERERTGIASLKVEYNRVHGFYIEVTNAHVEKIPDDYRRRQTLKNAERYITPELKTFEDKALSRAGAGARAREAGCTSELLDALSPAIPGAAGGRRRARARSTCSPILPSAPTRCGSRVPRSCAEPGIAIRGGRHPVVERQVDDFIPNDVDAGAARGAC